MVEEGDLWYNTFVLAVCQSNESLQRTDERFLCLATMGAAAYLSRWIVIVPLYQPHYFT